MVGLADDLRSHISGSSTGILSIIGFCFSGDAKISHPQISTVIQDEVFRFEVAVDDPTTVHVLQGQNDTSQEETCLLFLKLAAGAQVIPE